MISNETAFIWEDRGVGVPPQHVGNDDNSGSLLALLANAKAHGLNGEWGIRYISPRTSYNARPYPVTLIGKCPLSLAAWLARNAHLEITEIVEPAKLELAA